MKVHDSGKHLIVNTYFNNHEKKFVSYVFKNKATKSDLIQIHIDNLKKLKDNATNKL